MQNAYAQIFSGNSTTFARPREDNVPLPDEKQPRHSGWEIALEKDTHVRPTSTSAPVRLRLAPTTGVTTTLTQDRPDTNQSLFLRVISFVWKALVISFKTYVVLVLIYGFLVDGVPLMRAKWMGVKMA